MSQLGDSQSPESDVEESMAARTTDTECLTKVSTSGFIAMHPPLFSLASTSGQVVKETYRRYQGLPRVTFLGASQSVWGFQLLYVNNSSRDLKKGEELKQTQKKVCFCYTVINPWFINPQ